MTEAGLELLVLAPRRDAELTCGLLGDSSIRCVACTDADDLLRRIEERTGAVLLGEELVTDALLARLTEKLVAQEAWSDLPFMVVARDESRPGLVAALSALGNVTLLRRPMAPDALATAVAASFRARRRQLQVRDLMAEQREQSRLKDEFLAMLAHELRNPLAPVRYAARILQSDSLSPERRRETVALVERQTGHMARIIDQLLDATRAVRGLIEIAPERVDLGAIARESAEGFREPARSRNVDLRFRAETDVCVQADPVRIRQVIDNLVDNAIKFSGPGKPVRIEVARRDHHAVLQVADEGAGLDPALRGRIFEPFVQSSQAIDRRRGGLGLGLSIVRNLVRLHGGEVLAESAGPGQGSRFTVHLPLADMPCASPGRQDPWAHADTGPLRIMVAEDNVDSAESLKLLLELSGHEVRVVHTGLAAVEEIRASPPDVLVCDIGLPGMSGYEVARTLRRDASMAGLAMLALTGYGAEDDRREALAAGFDEHMTKPVNPTVLFECIARLAVSPRPPTAPGPSRALSPSPPEAGS